MTRVLCSFALRSPQCGYRQGLHFFCAVLLLVMPEASSPNPNSTPNPNPNPNSNPPGIRVLHNALYF